MLHRGRKTLPPHIAGSVVHVRVEPVEKQDVVRGQLTRGIGVVEEVKGHIDAQGRRILRTARVTRSLLVETQLIPSDSRGKSQGPEEIAHVEARETRRRDRNPILITQQLKLIHGQNRIRRLAAPARGPGETRRLHSQPLLGAVGPPLRRDLRVQDPGQGTGVGPSRGRTEIGAPGKFDHQFQLGDLLETGSRPRDQEGLDGEGNETLLTRPDRAPQARDLLVSEGEARVSLRFDQLLRSTVQRLVGAQRGLNGGRMRENAT